MNGIALMKNRVQKYAWGSPSAIPELLGEENPSGEPWAELWMGAHPKSPSLILVENEWISLLDVIEKQPRAVLGEAVAGKFDSRLPYLFKVLAIARPLSVQAHPDKQGAVLGFENENRLGIPMNAPNRNYRDDSHKPECICALTPFTALNGFRLIPNIIGRMERVCPAILSKDLDQLKTHPDSNGLKIFFESLMSLDARVKKTAVMEAAEKAKRLSGDDPAFEWMVRLHGEYPGDMGIFAPVLLNLVELEPGQAMFLPAGELHSYLHGTGIELMANSDNVLRGGLTPKHVDVPELLKVLTFGEKEVEILAPKRIGETESIYPTHAREFVLSVIDISEDGQEAIFCPRSVEILFCTDGRATITQPDSNGRINARKGTTVLVPASAGEYRILGTARFYKASVPV